MATPAKVVVKRDGKGTVTVNGTPVGRVYVTWLPGWLWVAMNPAGQRVGLGATRDEAVRELLTAASLDD